MTIDARLTVLLTLKGRDLYTLRWLWHANRVGLPFPIVIADGKVNPVIARLIEDPAAFPNLQIEYRRYNDLTFRDFYLKVQDAVSSVKTPYVMMSDNDDFLLPSGIIKSLDSLDRSLNYVSIGGGIGHFESMSESHQPLNLNGKIAKFWYQQSRAYQSYDLEKQSAVGRAVEAYAGFLTVCYNVFRTETLRKITDEMAQFNFQRLDNSELYFILRTATLGNVKSFSSCISYLRQLGTSSNPSRGKDFVVSLSNETFIDEIQRITKHIATIAAKIDGANVEEAAERLQTISAARLREKLVAVLGWRATVKAALKKHVPETIIACVKAVSERLRSGKSSVAGGRSVSRTGMLQLAREAGAAAALLAQTQQELADIEYTMASGDFISFVEASAQELLSQRELASSGNCA